MNRLFEAFVTRALRDRLQPPFGVEAQRVVHLDTGRRVPMRPDVVVRRHGAAAVAIDCKYKRMEAGDHRTDDFYQVLAYCTALGIANGMLVYPRHLTPVNETVAIRNVGIDVVEVALDLGGSRALTECELGRLIDVVLGRVGAISDLVEGAKGSVA